MVFISKFTSTKTETEVCIYGHTYLNGNITTKNNCTTTTTNDGEAGKTTTKTESKDPANQKQPEQPDPCQANPNRVGCVDLGEPPSEEIPKSTVNLTYAAESPFGGGSCPSDKTMNLRGQTIKVIDWSKWCSLTATYVRPLILLLATISAFFIVAVGRDQS